MRAGIDLSGRPAFVSHRSISAAALLPLFASLLLPAPALPWSVSMAITDKLAHPVAGALICAEGSGASCTETNAQGKATFVPAITTRSAIRSGSAAPGAADAFTLAFQGDRFSIFSPARLDARMARFDSRGKALGPALRISLVPGVNRLFLPDGKEGLFFFRVTGPGLALAGKALNLTASKASPAHADPAGGSSAPEARIMALGKVATANLNTLTVSKAGYRSVTYRPRTEADTGVLIRLAALEDSGLKYTGLLKTAITDIDSAAHTLEYAFQERTCSGDTLVTGHRTSTLPFWIRGGKWYFPAGNCQGVALGKESDGLFGIWKTLGVENLPAGMLPYACDPDRDSLVPSVVNLFFLNEGGGWDIDLRPDSMIIHFNRQSCPGSQTVFSIPYYDGQEGRPLLTRNTCREVVFKNPSQETGTYAFRIENDSLRGAFTYLDKACASPSVPVLTDLNAPKSCPETQANTLVIDSAFQSCIGNSGFLPAE